MKFYFVGIKGAGMCSLSNILVDLGYEVRGCDYSKKFFTDNKINNNVIVDSMDNLLIDNSYTYIIGNAYKLSNISNKIKNKCDNFYDYPDFIEKFFNMPKISISGTHGKTTTTSFISQITNVDCNVLCGDAEGIGKKDAKYLVLEACEYQNHFLEYTNKILLITNIEYDHPDYFEDLDSVVNSFQLASLNSQIVVVNGDCKTCLKIKHNNLLTFGIQSHNDIIFNYEIINNNTFVFINFYGSKIEIKLPLLSKHNVYNYVGGYIIAKMMDTSDEYIKDNSLNIKLPSRRLQTTKVNNSIVIDDYAHHPTEIEETINTVKEFYSDYKVVVLFQPHTYSRTIKFKNGFIKALNKADEVYILEVFSSVRETGYGNILLENTSFKKYNNDILKEIGKEKKVYMFMGAGDINNILLSII